MKNISKITVLVSALALSLFPYVADAQFDIDVSDLEGTTIEADGESVQIDESGNINVDEGEGGDTANIGTDGSVDFEESDGTSGSIDLDEGTVEVNEPHETVEVEVDTSTSETQESSSSGSVNVGSGDTGVNIDGGSGSVDVDAGGGTNVNVDGDGFGVEGDSSVEASSSGIKVESSGRGSVDINLGDISIQSDDGESRISIGGGLKVNANVPSRVQVRVGNTARNLNINVGNNSVNITSDDGSINIRSSDGSLSAQVRDGKINSEEKVIISSSPETAEVLVRDDSDLGEYARIVVETNPEVDKVEITRDRVKVGYKQRARLFGFIPSRLGASVVVSSDGNVDVDLPWYSFLFSKDTDTVKNSVSANLASSGGVSFTATSGSGMVKSQAKTVGVVSTSIYSTNSNPGVVNTEGDNANIEGEGGSVDTNGGVNITPN